MTSLLILIGILALIILVLMLVLRYENTMQHQQIAKKIAELPPHPEGTERIIQVVETQQEMTRQHVSNTMGSLAHETEMNKGLLHTLLGLYKDLVAVLTRVVTPKEPPKTPPKDDTQ
jgi:hypothetical protein